MPNLFDTPSDWLAFDKAHLWHPYTSMINPLPCYPVVGAKGNYIELADGTKLLDGTASWWSAIHGYNHPRLNKAIQEQTGRMSHVMFGGIAHQAASELGERLLRIAPNEFQHIFLADSGSIAVTVAMKMALQYWQSLGERTKQSFLTIRGGYHGDPFSCMSVSDPDNSAHALFPNVIAKHYFAPRPTIPFDGTWDPDYLALIRQNLEQNADQIAAIILEPIVQGAGGMWFYHPQYLRELRKLCDDYNTLLIFDEIATGFGRTGKMFAMEYGGIIPDIFCVGKALTGGVMTLAAVLTTQKIAHGISQGENPVLMHGPTFMGNPLACAVACTALDMLTETGPSALYPTGWADNIARQSKRLTQLYALKDATSVKDVRVLGSIGVVEMKTSIDVAKAQAFFVSRNVWIRPFGRLIYTIPPYSLNDDELDLICKTMMDYAISN